MRELSPLEQLAAVPDGQALPDEARPVTPSRRTGRLSPLEELAAEQVETRPPRRDMEVQVESSAPRRLRSRGDADPGALPGSPGDQVASPRTRRGRGRGAPVQRSPPTTRSRRGDVAPSQERPTEEDKPPLPGAQDGGVSSADTKSGVVQVDESSEDSVQQVATPRTRLCARQPSDRTLRSHTRREQSHLLAGTDPQGPPSAGTRRRKAAAVAAAAQPGGLAAQASVPPLEEPPSQAGRKKGRVRRDASGPPVGQPELLPPPGRFQCGLPVAQPQSSPPPGLQRPLAMEMNEGLGSSEGMLGEWPPKKRLRIQLSGSRAS